MEVARPENQRQGINDSDSGLGNPSRALVVRSINQRVATNARGDGK